MWAELAKLVVACRAAEALSAMAAAGVAACLWPGSADVARAVTVIEIEQSLGLKADASFADIIRQYIDDCRAGGATQALKGLDA